MQTKEEKEIWSAYLKLVCKQTDDADAELLVLAKESRYPNFVKMRYRHYSDSQKLSDERDVALEALHDKKE